MFRFLFRLTFTLVAVFAGFNAAARAFGRLQPPNPALAGFTEGCEGKPPPCWYGIVPGKTSVEAAQRLLERAQVRIKEFRVNLTGAIRGEAARFCAFELGNDGQVITLIQVRYCPEHEVSLGQFMLAWGTPLGTRYSVEPIRPAQVIFRGTTVSVSGLRSPYERVQRLVLFQAEAGMPIVNHWFGFAPPWRYCQLEPNVPPCSSPFLP
ncbi:MAG: hypothetical protein HZC41_00480 [Chloroflexi bacterium]|nr:hypothetical protein [Chloroflexota bacterium]